jgi:hypothetical protein
MWQNKVSKMKNGGKSDRNIKEYIFKNIRKNIFGNTKNKTFPNWMKMCNL